ncbi:MAG: phosphodiester glycosidase family protein [Anaerolineales bacterium]|nr:phosphodiester glycosidase family protein [Anaerolineales bacterium]
MLFLLCPFSFEMVHAITPIGIIPDDFTIKLAATGVQLYMKEYKKGNPDFVQVIALDQGAVVEPLVGDIVDTRAGKGVYGGDDPRFTSKTLSVYWEDYLATHTNAFCVINGGFFFMKEYPTRVPFPIKKGGFILSDGYGIKDFVGQKLILELWDGYADILELSQDALYSSQAPDIIGGLTEDANKAADKIVGRTFIGVDDQNGDGKFETLLIFSTKSARQIEAANTLRTFGADKIMMLDGGESAQLICQGKTLIESERLLPQAVGISAAPAFSFIMTETPIPANNDIIQKNEVSAHTKTPRLKKTKTALGIQSDLQTAEAMTAVSPELTLTPSTLGSTPSSDVWLIPITLLLLAPFIFLVVIRIRKEKR